jgi:hypothetical protein
MKLPKQVRDKAGKALDHGKRLVRVYKHGGVGPGKNLTDDKSVEVLVFGTARTRPAAGTATNPRRRVGKKSVRRVARKAPRRRVVRRRSRR